MKGLGEVDVFAQRRHARHLLQLSLFAFVLLLGASIIYFSAQGKEVHTHAGDHVHSYFSKLSKMDCEKRVCRTEQPTRTPDFRTSQFTKFVELPEKVVSLASPAAIRPEFLAFRNPRSPPLA